MRLVFSAVIAAFLSSSALAAPDPVPNNDVRMMEMTWQEVRDAVKAGKTTVIIPTGGTEQNGPHIVLGKHNFTIRVSGAAIATKLGDALVGPVLAYVPEGDFSPASGNMRFPGTFNLRPETFAAVLEDTALSMKQAGFKTICFVGEHGGSQAVQKAVAEKLTAAWAGDHVKVLHINAYYDETNGQNAYIASTGEKDADPQAHGGLADTSEMLAMHPDGVRQNLRGPYTAADMDKLGVEGPSDHATKELGMKLVDLKVDAAVKQIQKER